MSNEERIHAHWIQKYPNSEHPDTMYCSHCNFYVEDKINNVEYSYKFCPNCDAIMTEKEITEYTEEFTPDDGVHKHYAKVELDIPCKLSEVHFIDYLHDNVTYTPYSNRFSVYTSEGHEINEYALEKLDWQNFNVLTVKLSDIDEWYIGYKLKIRIDLSDRNLERGTDYFECLNF